MEEQVVESAEQAVIKTEELKEVQVETPAEETVIEEPPKKKQTAQERINELTRIRRDKEREAEYWKGIALEKKEPPKEPNLQLPQRPKQDQFETTESYEDALFKWNDNIREIKSQAEQKEKEVESSLKTFNERARKLRSENEDFDEVIDAPVFTNTMREAIVNSENGPQIAYHLGRAENRDEAERIRNLPPARQIYELGKLEFKLLMMKQTKKVTTAPEPIKPGGMSGTGGELDPSKMGVDEWRVWRKNQRIEKIKKKHGG